jgi:glycerophosphoryl diester phosphodiesterase
MLTILLALCIGRPSPKPALDLTKRLLRRGHHFIVCAHRGDHVVAVENTLDAYERAAKDGADFGETDLRMTKDGVIVLMHDGTVDRTTDGHGRVSDLTFAQIRALHLKGAPRPDEKVPTFEELLDDIKGKLYIYMDIKAVRAKDVLPILIKHHMLKDVIAYVYGPLQRDEWRRDAPEIPVISDLDAMKSPDQIESDWKAHPFAITDGGYEDYMPPFIQKWHELGVCVVPDIQSQDESPAKWQPMIDMGVDGLQTDHPSELIKYLKKKKIR